MGDLNLHSRICIGDEPLRMDTRKDACGSLDSHAPASNAALEANVPG